MKDGRTLPGVSREFAEVRWVLFFPKFLALTKHGSQVERVKRVSLIWSLPRVPVLLIVFKTVQLKRVWQSEWSRRM
jgi:hypothetical protein